MYAPVADETTIRLKECIIQTAHQRRRFGYRRIAVAVSGKPHQSTGATL
jgi:hypothetical protein